MAASALNLDPKVLTKVEQKNVSIPASTLLVEDDRVDQELIQHCMGNVLVFTDQKQLVYANDGAYKTLSQLHQDEYLDDFIPDEIWHICQSLIQIRDAFPGQNWLIEFDIFTSKTTLLHIRSRWFKSNSFASPCLLLTIEDRQEAIVNIVLEDAEKYGLTPREKEVWLLQHHGYTYKQIAAQLGITPNTVKKHMRSIHSKRNDLLLLDDQAKHI